MNVLSLLAVRSPSTDLTSLMSCIMAFDVLLRLKPGALWCQIADRRHLKMFKCSDYRTVGPLHSPFCHTFILITQKKHLTWTETGNRMCAQNIRSIVAPICHLFSSISYGSPGLSLCNTRHVSHASHRSLSESALRHSASSICSVDP